MNMVKGSHYTTLDAKTEYRKSHVKTVVGTGCFVTNVKIKVSNNLTKLHRIIITRSDLMARYIVYKSYLKPNKGKLPDVIKEYIADTSFINAHIEFTRKREDAYRFIDCSEAESVAYLLDMETEKIDAWE